MKEIEFCVEIVSNWQQDDYYVSYVIISDHKGMGIGEELDLCVYKLSEKILNILRNDWVHLSLIGK